MEYQPIFSASFGELLKTARKRQRLTQKQLAQRLGVHINTISAWELGAHLPDSRGLVLEAARCLALDESATRQLLEASLTALSPYWLVPFPRNPFFTGREDILEALHTQLRAERVVALTQSYALHGLGGIGKTQIALEYAYRHALEYSAVFWIGAETVEHIMASMLRIAEILHLPERQEADQQRIAAAVRQWLSSHQKWLLIWDNLEDLDLAPRWFPPARQGTILVTTCSPALGIVAQGMALPPMEPEEGLLLLLRRARVLGADATREQVQAVARRLPAEYAAAAELVTVLGGLPLALDQAGAYIEETGCSLAEYLQRYQQQQAYLLSRRGLAGGDHPDSVTATFTLAGQRVEQEQHAAADLLRVCALLHAEAIPEEVFLVGAAHLGPTLAPLAADLTRFDQAIAALRRLSLVQRHPQTHTLSLHRLVQAVLRERMSEQEQTLWLGRAIKALNAVFPEVTYDTWGQCERLLPHVLTCAAALPDDPGDQPLAEVLRKAAEYLRVRARYEQAQPLYERALRLLEQGAPLPRCEIATLLNGLALLYRDQGKYREAEPLFQRALSTLEQAPEKEQSQIALVLVNLAVLYREQGNYTQAEPLFQRALGIREQTLGRAHPEVALLLTNLGLLYWRLGKYAQVEPFHQRALRILRQGVGPDHPQTAYPLVNLALLYWKLGKYAQAEPLYQRAIAIWEHALGPDHPEVAYALLGLALLYAEQGRHAQAELLNQRALSLWERALGPGHHQVALALADLAKIAAAQGKSEQAELLNQRALGILEQTLGRAHPQVAQPLYNLAALYAGQGKDEQAERLYQRALSLLEQTLGPDHPDLAYPLHGLATLYLRQGKAEQAEPLLERAYSIRETQLGRHHPETVSLPPS